MELLNKKGEKVFLGDEKGQIEIGDVMENVAELPDNQVDYIIEGMVRKLPSRHQLDSDVSINFYDAGFIRKARVIKVHFTLSKVLYDVEICTNISPAGEENNLYTRLYNIDSVYVKDFVN